MSFLQKIPVSSNRHEFAMFNLIGLLPINQIIAFIAMV